MLKSCWLVVGLRWTFLSVTVSRVQGILHTLSIAKVNRFLTIAVAKRPVFPFFKCPTTSSTFNVQTCTSKIDFETLSIFLSCKDHYREVTLARVNTLIYRKPLYAIVLTETFCIYAIIKIPWHSSNISTWQHILNLQWEKNQMVNYPSLMYLYQDK